MALLGGHALGIVCMCYRLDAVLQAHTAYRRLVPRSRVGKSINLQQGSKALEFYSLWCSFHCYCLSLYNLNQIHCRRLVMIN